MEYEIVKSNAADFDHGIWEIFKVVTASGDTYIYPPETTKAEARKIWLKERVCYVARDKTTGLIVGTYTIRPNVVGLGSHVANAGFMVHPIHRNKKIGLLMGEHALKEAKKLGFLAMQFNVVVSTNERAIYLWQKMGFKIIGTVPKAFNHKSKGLVDIHIMHRFL
jgi:GNAT superfamily N-acetyltransferase